MLLVQCCKGPSWRGVRFVKSVRCDTWQSWFSPNARITNAKISQVCPTFHGSFWFTFHLWWRCLSSRFWTKDHSRLQAVCTRQSGHLDIFLSVVHGLDCTFEKLIAVLLILLSKMIAGWSRWTMKFCRSALIQIYISIDNVVRFSQNCQPVLVLAHVERDLQPTTPADSLDCSWN